MFEQGFITACMRAVASDKPVVYAPSAVCLRYLKDARQHVPAVTSYDFKHLTQTIKPTRQAVYNNDQDHISFTTHLPTRQAKTVRMQVMQAHPGLSRSLCSFVTKSLLWQINGIHALHRPTAERYKDPSTTTVGQTILSSAFALRLVREHTDNLHTVGLKPTNFDGFLSCIPPEYRKASTQVLRLSGLLVQYAQGIVTGALPR